MKQFSESGSEIRENMNISETIHAIHAQMSTILCSTSEHIVLKYEVNHTVTFWDTAKKQNPRVGRQFWGVWHLAENLRYPPVSLMNHNWAHHKVHYALIHALQWVKPSGLHPWAFPFVGHVLGNKLSYGGLSGKDEVANQWNVLLV